MTSPLRCCCRPACCSHVRASPPPNRASRSPTCAPCSLTPTLTLTLTKP